MRYKVIAVSILAFTFSPFAMAQQHAAQRTIFVPAMGGFEKNVVSALSAEEVPVKVVMEQANSDLQVKPALSSALPSIEVALYNKQTGHDPFSFLDVVEVKTNRVLLTYRFLSTDDAAARTTAAREFATELRKKLVAE